MQPTACEWGKWKRCQKGVEAFPKKGYRDKGQKGKGQRVKGKR